MINFEIPSIISTRRSFGVIIALILSSAIFVSSYSLLYSMENINDDFFGKRDDILVIYNTEATTPFTSNVPRILENSLSSIDGVLIVSPEIFLPAMVNEEPVYVRGTKFDKIIEMENLKIVDGSEPSGIYEVMIGKSLADRLSLNINTNIDIYSIVSEKVVKLFIRGIYETDGIINDEILTSIVVASSLSRVNGKSFTHIRAQYDKNQISEDRIIELTTETFNKNFDFVLGNGSKSIEKYSIKITDNFDNKIYENKIEKMDSVSFVRGWFDIEILDDTGVLQRNRINVDDNSDIIQTIEDFIFEVNISVEYNGSSMNNLSYRIFDSDEVAVQSGITNVLGEIETVLPSGDYSIKFEEWGANQRYNISVNSPLNSVIGINITNILRIDDLDNNTLILKNSFIFNLGNMPDMYRFFADKIEFIPIFLNNYYVNLNLSDGYHILSLYRGEILVWRRSVEVRSDISAISSSQLYSKAHYNLNQLIGIKLTGIKSFDIDLDYRIVNRNMRNINIELSLPNTIGFHEIKITADDFLNNRYVKKWKIIIDSDNKKLGWVSPVDIPVVRLGDNITIWIAESNQSSIVVDTGELISKENITFVYQIPNNKTGNYISGNKYSVNVSYNNYSTKLSYFIVRQYSELFILKNSSYSVNLYELSNSTEVVSGTDIQLDFDPSYFESMDNLSDISLNQLDYFWNIEIISENRSIDINEYIPNMNGSVKIYLSSIITGSSEIINFNTLNYLEGVKLPIPITGVHKYSESGIIDLLDISNNLLNYTLLKSGTEFNPIYLTNSRILLSPGDYTITTSYFNQSISTSNYLWDVEVLNSTQIDTIKIPYIANTWGSITTDKEIKLLIGKYFTRNDIITVSNDILPEYRHLRNINNDTYEIEMMNIQEGEYSIILSNGTEIHDNYIGKIILEDNVELVDAVFSAIVIDKNLVSHTIGFEFKLGIDVIDINLVFENRSLTAISDVFIELNLDETGEKLSYFLTKNNSSIFINTVPQNAVMRYVFNGIMREEIIYINGSVINIGDPVIKFTTYNKNYNSYSDSSKISLSYESGVNYLSTVANNELSIEIGNYVVYFNDNEFYGKKLIEITMTTTIQLDFDLLNWSSIFQVNKVPIKPSIMILKHDILGLNFEYPLNNRENRIMVNEFPVGNATLVIQGDWGRWEQNIMFKFGKKEFVVNIVNEEFEVNEDEIYDLQIDNLLKIVKIDFVISEDYLKEFLKGALIIIQTILFAQIIIILIVLIYNVVEITSSLTHESRHEIKLVLALGASKRQAIFAYTKKIIILSVFISVVGHLIAAMLVHFMVISSNTVFFGHKFTPTVFIPSLFIFNLIMTFVTSIFGMNLSYNREILASDNIPSD